jgi:hypothetical protein
MSPNGEIISDGETITVHFAPPHGPWYWPAVTASGVMAMAVVRVTGITFAIRLVIALLVIVICILGLGLGVVRFYAFMCSVCLLELH